MIYTAKSQAELIEQIIENITKPAQILKLLQD